MRIAETLAAAALTGLLAAPRARADGAPGAAAFEAQAAAAWTQVRLLLRSAGRAAPAAEPAPSDHIQPANLPELGKWMLDGKGRVADWLGEVYEGKRLAEPINVVLYADTDDPALAEGELLRATRASGFTDKLGHSSGYRAWLAGALAPQYPRRTEHAFSDGPFLVPNDHGRIFGPVLWNGREYFIGAFSRENVNIRVLPFKFRHPYDSFVAARERFVARMTTALFRGYVSMGNALPSTDPERTTGDHDGLAAVIELR